MSSSSASFVSWYFFGGHLVGGVVRFHRFGDIDRRSRSMSPKRWKRTTPPTRCPPKKYQETNDAEDEDIEDRRQAVQEDGQGSAASRAAEQPAQVRVEDLESQASPRPRRRRTP